MKSWLEWLAREVARSRSLVQMVSVAVLDIGAMRLADGSPVRRVSANLATTVAAGSSESRH